jgi:hypothetical protein
MGRNWLSYVLFLVVLIGSYSNKGTLLLTSAQSSFNRQRNHRSRPSDHSVPSFPPPPPPPPPPPLQEWYRVTHDSDESNTSDRLEQEVKYDATALLSKMKSSAERFVFAKKSSLQGILSSTKFRLASKNTRRLSASKRPDWRTTTRLSGGADPPDDSVVESSDNSSSNSSSEATPAAQARTPTAKHAFLGSLRLREKPLFPKTLSGNGAALAKKVKEGVSVMQQTSSQVGPSFLTALSLIWTADKGISFLSLYGISLLGASCGFYLFLYFITIGYALGVTLPLVAALYVYSVRTVWMMG